MQWSQLNFRVLASDIMVWRNINITWIELHWTDTYHHCANIIWRHWNCKMPVRYNLSSVWVRFSIFSRLSIIQHVGAVCFQFTHFLCDDWENIHALPYYHHQVGSMNYYPSFRVRSWNNGMRCMSFYILYSYVQLDPLSIEEANLYS